MSLSNLTQNARSDALVDSAYEFLSDRRVMIGMTVLPALLLFLIIVLIPMVMGILTSFFEVPLYATGQYESWEFAGISNYRTILTDPQFLQSMWLSILFALGSVALQLTVGIGLALLINKQFRFGSWLRAIVLLPYLIPTAALGFIALWMGNSQFGILNQLLVSIGILDSPIAWYTDESLAMVAVILTSSWKFSIFVTLMVLARLQGIPDSLYEAATVAGATTYMKFRDITLPNLKGVIFIVLLLRGIWMFNKFDIIDILTGGGPGQKTTTLPIYGYELAFASSELSTANTVSTIMFVLVLVVAAIYFRVLNPEEEVRVE